MRILPSAKYQDLPCSYVGTGCAWENLYGTPFTDETPEGLHQDGYLSLNNMNTYIRSCLPIKKKTYYSKVKRPLLKDFLKEHKDPMVICVLGHCIYANNGNYTSFFDNDNDPVVCVWFINNTKE